MCMISRAKSTKLCNRGRQWPLDTTGPLVPGEIQVHATSRPVVVQHRLLTGTAPADLTYAKALQCWVEKAQPLIPSEPCHLPESVLELRWAMEPLVTFSDEEVFMAAAPPNWVEVTMPSPAEPAPADYSHSCSCSCNTWACPRGSLMAAHSGDWHAVTEKRDEPAILPWELTQLPLPEHKSPCPLPGFIEIARSLGGKQPTDDCWCPCRRGWRVLWAS